MKNERNLPEKKSALIDASRQRLQALVDRDWLLLGGLLHPSLCYTHASGSTQDYDTYLEKLRQGIRYRTAQSDIETATVHTEVGVVTGLLDVDLTRVDGSEYRARSRITEVWLWDGNNWLLSAFQSTALRDS